MVRRGLPIWILGLCLASVTATFAQVKKKELIGKSIEADFMVREVYTLYNEGGITKKIDTAFRHLHHLYVSKAGRLFHRRMFYDENGQFRVPNRTFDRVRGKDEWLSFDERVGIVVRGIPTADGTAATIVDIVTITIKRQGDELVCDVDRKFALAAGARELIAYNSPTAKKVFSSMSVAKKTCRILNSNIFQTQKQ